MFAFTRAQPFDLLFSARADAAQVLIAGHARQVAGYRIEITALLQHAIDNGTLALR